MQPSLLFLLPKSVKTITATPNAVVSKVWEQKKNQKEKKSSKRGAFYYKLNKRKYEHKFDSFLNFVANPDNVK